jgi:hypothetical protein
VEERKTPLIGVVLNQVPLNAGGDYGCYTSNYAYYSDGARSRSRRSGDSRSDLPAAGGAAPEKDRLVLRERDKT